MSTGCNCMFFEQKKGVWFYTLEHYNAPKNSWDWTEYADTFGPFGSFDAADAHLSQNHANPGGYNRIDWREGRTPEEQKRFDDLAGKVQKPRRTSGDTFRAWNNFGRRY